MHSRRTKTSMLNHDSQEKYFMLTTRPAMGSNELRCPELVRRLNSASAAEMKNINGSKSECARRF